MPPLPDTSREIESLIRNPPPVRTDYWHAKTVGFLLRVTPAGVATWNVVYRVDGKKRRHTLGRYSPQLGLAKAHQDAKAALRREDPAGEKRAQRERERQTLAAAFRAYVEHSSQRHEAKEFRSWPAVKKHLERDLIPALGDRPIRDVKRREVLEMVTAKARNAPIGANRLLAYTSAFLSWAVDAGWCETNPCWRLRKPARARSRDRVLSVDELRTLVGHLRDVQPAAAQKRDRIGRLIAPDLLESTLRDLFMVLVLTGQRLTETAKMRWADLEAEDVVWTIPATMAKNGREHRVPLSRQVRSIIAKRRELPSRDEQFVFSNRREATSVAARAKRYAATLSRRLATATPTHVDPFRAHDLRRTLATGLGDLGLSREVIARVLNHRTLLAGVTGVYDRSTQDLRKREALQAWADRVDAIAGGNAGVVVRMKAGRRGQK